MTDKPTTDEEVLIIPVQPGTGNTGSEQQLLSIKIPKPKKNEAK